MVNKQSINKLVKGLVPVVAIVVLVLLVSRNNEDREIKVTDNKSTPYHEQVLDILQKNNSVKPKALPVHPVTTVHNREAIIPPMCYTKTQGEFNPCYVCHQDPIKGRENTMGDGDLQVEYSFSDEGMQNHWKNLFEDRSEAVSKISDKDILAWINEDNYSELALRLKEIGFKGWIPDLENLQEAEKAFDSDGFAKDGSHWIAFNYKPLPSTFWPTNGNTDDVMIKLEKVYRTDNEGRYSKDVYLANLSIVEAHIKNLESISTPDIDEKKIGLDLDQDGKLGVINHITKVDQYVGAAEKYFLQAGTYPAKTEFLHTVRYLGFDEQGNIRNSRRIKEVRYMKKWVAHPLVAIREYYREEGYAKDEGLLPQYTNLRDHGLDNGMGWAIQSFIEDRNGRLRTATYEENLFCMGCHNSIGSTIDKTFSFARKIDGAEGWGYINLKGMKDVPNMGEEKGEFATYFERVGGGGEFRSNPEMQQRWFNDDGTPKQDKIANAKDVYELITPSIERAMSLNKAYRVIVEAQDYIYGRDATITPPKNVYESIDNETAPTLPKDKIYKWDIRLNWDEK